MSTRTTWKLVVSQCQELSQSLTLLFFGFWTGLDSCLTSAISNNLEKKWIAHSWYSSKTSYSQYVPFVDSREADGLSRAILCVCVPH